MNKYHIPNLEKTCQVLEMISNSKNGCLLKDISAQLSIPRTTALRITETLLDSNYLMRKDDGSLALGSTLIQLGIKALDSFDVRTYARPVLQELSTNINESSHLAALDGTKARLIEVCDSPRPIRIAARPGTLVDLHCSSTGKIFLAYSIEDPEEFCKDLELTVHTPNTHATIDDVLKGIEETRMRGYAVDDEEYFPGVRCIAAPIMNAFGKTVDAIGITSSASTLTKARVEPTAAMVLEAAEIISEKLGYRADID